MFDKFIRKPARRFLLKLLILTEGRKETDSITELSGNVCIGVSLTPWVVYISVFLVFTLCYWNAHERLWQGLTGSVLLSGLMTGAFFAWVNKETGASGSDAAIRNSADVSLLGLLVCLGAGSIALITGANNTVSFTSSLLSPVPAIALLSALLVNARAASACAALLCTHTAVLEHFNALEGLVLFSGSIVVIIYASRVRTREDITKIGLKCSLAQALAVSAIFLLGFGFARYLFNLAWALANGIISALLALGALPVLESVFAKVTNIKLLELADVNHPLLKRLSLEAPGTYHHSQVVATLAEAAAEAIGANGLLCRVGAYYHDIGKMVKPEYFIENQDALGNPHDPLPPSMSRLVILSHVKDGLALAKEHRLNPALADFILMHHGTSRIEYFYRRALEEGEADNEEIYRYPGPKPVTKETAINMLADAVEAVSRTLDVSSPQRLQDAVYKIVNNKFIDGQLDDSGVTLRDLHRIAESFTNTLASVLHARINYPEPQK